jgi:ATP-binding cassette subfamily B protein
MYFINLAAAIVFSLFFMLQASPKLTVITLSPLPLLAITIYFVNTIIHKKSERIQALLSELTTNAQESYSGIRVIKSFVQEKAMLGFFTRNSEEYKKKCAGVSKDRSHLFPQYRFDDRYEYTGDHHGRRYGCGEWSAGSQRGYNRGICVVHSNAHFPGECHRLDGKYDPKGGRLTKKGKRVFTNNPRYSATGRAAKPAINSSIVFSDVNFAYPHTGIHAIKDFSLNIRTGEKVAIVGRTGSGKSTISQLLLRMYDVQEGLIMYDGVPINKIDLNWLRSQISYVPQDVFLFSETVQNNISFGIKTIDLSQVRAAARKASIDQEIEGFAKGYQTMVGERGVTLSGGQKQRISIARALVKEPSLVIFDDCLSAVDAKTEKEIWNNLNEWWNDKTVVVITHRIFSLVEFDKVIVMEDGRIIEQGTHAGLMRQGGYYAEMYARQQEQDTGS